MIEQWRKQSKAKKKREEEERRRREKKKRDEEEKRRREKKGSTLTINISILFDSIIILVTIILACKVTLI